MCGIAGIWNFDGRKVKPQEINHFTDSLAHRGPDGRGVWIDETGSLAFGHRRLAILDLTADGHQPMLSHDGRYVITYNGEIYNFLELLKELQKKGYIFTSSSDTEIILAAYQEWGEEMLLRFNGMWAFAIYDKIDRSLFIARDRFGIKPFHYLLTDKQFAFASELKSFKCLEGYQPVIDRESAIVFLNDSFGLEGSRRTMLKGICRLQAGHSGTLKNGRLTLRRWWNTLDHLIEPPKSLFQQAEQFRELFYDAVRLRMRSDVSIGSCLSGGFDSSAVVCAMSQISKTNVGGRQAGDWHQCFIATFPGSINDERVDAEEVIRYSGATGNFLTFNDSDALAEIDRILNDFDDVYIGMPTVVWQTFRELRKAKVTVSLNGHGADELMGAYLSADKLIFQDAPSLVFSPLRNIDLLRQYSSSIQRFAHLNSVGIRTPVQAMFEFHPSLKHIRRSVKKISSRINRSLSIELDKSYISDVSLSNSSDYNLVGHGDVMPDHWGPLTRNLYEMFHSRTLPTILRNFDRLSMAHGVEERMPFMDWRLASFVFSLPDVSKICGGINKLVAREAMRGRMPESIRDARHKIGFNSPLPEWLNGPLIPWAKELISAKSLQCHDLINIKEFSRVFEAHTNNKSWSWQNCGDVWATLNLIWFENKFLNS